MSLKYGPASEPLHISPLTTPFPSQVWAGLSGIDRQRAATVIMQGYWAFISSRGFRFMCASLLLRIYYSQA